jgi:hypothetical protein
MNHRERQRRPAVRDQDGDRQHGVMAAMVAPCERPVCVFLDLSKRWRDRSVVAHPATVTVIRVTRKGPAAARNCPIKATARPSGGPWELAESRNRPDRTGGALIMFPKSYPGLWGSRGKVTQWS